MKSRGGFWEGVSWMMEKGQETCLSHLSLEFRHGSQLMALRARFVGGRPSGLSEPGGGVVRCRTVPVVERAGFERTVEGAMERWSSAMVWGGMGQELSHLSLLDYLFLPSLRGPCKGRSAATPADRRPVSGEWRGPSGSETTRALIPTRDLPRGDE